MKNHLRVSGEFKRVYAQGKRYDGTLMTAFVMPNNLTEHRLGITVSRKTALLAVDRNRAKRLLRESFRLRQQTLVGLTRRYDWVFNGKRILITSPLTATLRDVDAIITRVQRDEGCVAA